MALFKLFERSISFISTLVLARLLTPGDFGLVAMAMSIVALTELMSSMGFDTALIQRRDAGREHYDTAWSYNLLFGGGVALILLLLSWPASIFYHEPRLVQVIPVLALASLIQGLENVGVVAFRKEMNFRKEFVYLLGKKFSTFAITVTLAIMFQTYWALVLGIVAGRALGVSLSYVLQSYRPRFCLSAGRDLFHFSKWLVLNNLIFFLESRSTDFILGRTIGAQGLGTYAIAYQIATMPSTELVAPLNRAAMPGYSKAAHDPEDLRKTFLGVISMVAILIFPVGFGLAAVAEPAVHFLLGPKWLDAIPLIRLLALCGIIMALHSNLNQIYIAMGIPRIITTIAAIFIVLLLPTLVYVSHLHGAIGAATVMFSFTIITTPFIHGVFFRVASVPVRAYIQAIWRPLAASLIMAGTIWATSPWLSSHTFLQAPGAILASCVTLGAVLYLSWVLLFWVLVGRPDGAESALLTLVKSRLVKLHFWNSLPR